MKWPVRPDQPDAAWQSLISVVLARLSADERVRRTLPDEGRIHFDRPMPFLCVYRRPPSGDDPGTEQLVTSETAFITASSQSQGLVSLRALLRPVVEALSTRFGAFLIVEIWSADDVDPSKDVHPDSGEPLPLAPAFTISARGELVAQRTLDSLSKSLRKISVFKQPSFVEMDEQAKGHPPGMKPLFSLAEAEQMGCYVIGLEVRPIYRHPENRAIFPAVLRAMQRGLGRALKEAFFTFAGAHTNIRPRHHWTLGRRTVVKAVWDVDQRLAEIANSFDFLLQATPINAEAAWREFKRAHFEHAPVFHYRPMAVEPAMLKRRLYDIPIERIEDHTLAHLFREKQDELDRKITMLTDVGTRRFLPGSLQIYGGPDRPLLELAADMLDRIGPRSRDRSAGKPLGAQAFAQRAREEVEYYRKSYPRFDAKVTVRDDIYSGLLVSGGGLLIGNQTKVPTSRVDALLQHEIGTHLVTYYNGLAQPFRQLDSGLAGYDGLQEGLAVLSEYLVGGLSRPRLRLLAARVVATHALTEGATFVDTFRLLRRIHNFPMRTAYTITMRIYRGGGLTKDMVYLQGFAQILDYLGKGGEIEPLLVGKLAPDHIPLIKELRHRRVLRAPPLQPRYMTDPRALERLAQLRPGRSVLDLVDAKP